MTSVVSEVRAWQALDSRGRPTVGVVVRTADGARGRAVVPSGASTGAHEARELRDGGPDYDGMGVTAAVENVHRVLAPLLIGHPVHDQRGIDTLLEHADGSPALGVLGANAVLGVSLAVLGAAADQAGGELHEYLDPTPTPLLPRPMFNIVSGGAHAGRQLDIQDVLAVPLRADTFAQAISIGSRVRAGTAAAFNARGLPTSLVADEGGLAARLSSNGAALELVHEGIQRAGLLPGVDVGIAIDVAATQFYADGVYHLDSEGRDLSAAELVEEVSAWIDAFDVVSVEDVLAEDDWDGWREATRRLADRVQLIGDDLFVTNTRRVQQGITSLVGSAVLVKPNQAGTVSRAADVVQLARRAGYATIVSARSGDTEDAWLADLAVGWRAGQIKVGSTTRSERTAKWNRLLELEAQLGDAASYA